MTRLYRLRRATGPLAIVSVCAIAILGWAGLAHATDRFAGRETQPVSGWTGVASIQPGSAAGYLFVVCIA
jgi:hypothetical protein